MTRAGRVVLAALALGSQPFFSAASAPRITATFPPPVDTRDPDRTLAKTARGAADQLAFSPDGRVIAAAGADKVVRIWDAQTGEQGTGELRYSLGPVNAIISALGFSADGKTLAALSEDQVVNTWDPASGKSLASAPTKPISRYALFVPGNEPLLAEGTPDGARIWNYRTGEVVRQYPNRDGSIRLVTFTPDGKTIAGLTRSGGIRIWNTESGELLRAVETRTLVVALVASATQLAVGGAHGGVQLLPIAAAGKPIDVGGEFPAAFSPKGDQIATSYEKSVGVWDTATGQLLCSNVGQPADVVSVAFSPNGQKMASGDAQGYVCTWTVPLPLLAKDDLEKIEAAVPAAARVAPKKPRHLLIFWRSDAILHKGGVPAANHAFAKMGEKTGAFTVEFSRDYAALTPAILAKYDAIVLNSTAHLVIPDAAKKALVGFTRNGGGVIGIHAAIDTFKGWPEGAGIIGATFGGHPWVPSGTWAIRLPEPDHPLVRAWAGKTFKIQDELYEMAEPYTRADRRVLLMMDLNDPATAHPGAEPLHRQDGDFAIAWIKHFGAGRVFYGGFGHGLEPFENPAVLQFYLDGTQYVLGDLEISAEDEVPRSDPP